MGTDTTTDREQLSEGDRDNRVKATAKKATGKKAAKKTIKKRAATAGKRAATPRKRTKAGTSDVSETAAVATATERPSAPAAQPQPAWVPPVDEAHSGGAMRGIVALWGPLAIIVLLIVVSRLGGERLDGRDVAGLSPSLNTGESVAPNVQDALSGAGSQAASVLGARASGDLVASFDNSGVTAAPPGPVLASPPPKSAVDPWAPPNQTITPALVSGVPGTSPPDPANPWAPVNRPVAAVSSTEAYSQGDSQGDSRGDSRGGGIPVPGAGDGYAAYGGAYARPGAYPPPRQGYPPLPSGYGSATPPSYVGESPGYPQQQAYGAAAPFYNAPSAYGVPPAYAYPPQPYGAPAPYPPGYYPPQ